jgi:malate/lactate dehydrogenase
MKLEDIARTEEARYERRLLYDARFGIPVDKEPLIGIMGVGAIAEAYLGMMSMCLDSLLYRPRFVLIGREKDTSRWRKEHNLREGGVILRENRFSIMDYEELSDSISMFDLLFLTIGLNADSKDRMASTDNTLSVIDEVLTQIPLQRFNGNFVGLSNPSDVVAQYVAKVFPFKSKRQILFNGPLDLMRDQYVIIDRLNLKGISGKDLRLSVGGNHQFPYVSTNNVFLESFPGISREGRRTLNLRDISEEVKKLNGILKQKGDSISNQAKQIAFESFDLYRRYGGKGTPTIKSTAASMVELTRAIINRFGSTAVSFLTENGVFEYGNCHFTNGFAEPDEERVRAFSMEDLREIAQRREKLEEILRGAIGRDYKVRLPSDTVVLESIFCPRGRQEQERPEEIIITESDDGIKARRNKYVPALRELLRKGISSRICAFSPNKRKIISYEFNGRFKPEVSTLNTGLEGREYKRTKIEEFVQYLDKIIGLTMRVHVCEDNEYGFIVWDSKKEYPELSTEKFSVINGERIKEVSRLAICQNKVRFGFLSQNGGNIASYDFNSQQPRLLFRLKNFPLALFDYHTQTISACIDGIFNGEQKMSSLGFESNGWINLAEERGLLFYSTDSGLYVIDLNSRDSTIVNSEGYANDVLEYDSRVQTVVYVRDLGILITDYDSEEQIFEGEGNEKLIRDKALNNPQRIITQDQNIFFVLGESGFHAVYHNNDFHHVEKLPLGGIDYLEVDIHGI